MPGTVKLEHITSAAGSDVRQTEIQHNNVVSDVQGLMIALTSDALLGFYGLGANSGSAPMARGSTDTQVGLAAMVFTVAGVPVVKAASAAGTTFGALGTIPTATWGIIALDVVAAGTITFASGAANYTTGYATEALAIAALPARITVKARIGYVTILAASPGWVAATDALAGGSSGAPATTTNYYPYVGAAGATGTNLNGNGILTASVPSSGSAWTGGRNGVLIATALSRGSSDTQVATTAFTFNANGLNNVPKAAVAAGTALGALGTTPADKWALFTMYINGAGTITYLAAPGNVSPGYTSEAQAIGDLGNMFPTAGLCQIGYFTVKTAAGLAWIAGTDALGGGTTGNEASATNYYPTPGITYGAGETASLIATRTGTVLASAQY